MQSKLVYLEFYLILNTCDYSGNPVVVRLGEHNLSDDNDDTQPEDYQVVQVIPHPRYKSSVKYNDIALLRLETPVRLTDKIRPACLSSSESYTAKPIASGWGRTHFGNYVFIFNVLV